MMFINDLIVPTIIILIIFFGYFKKINVYECFLDGCKDGFKIIIDITPTIITMIFVINVFVDSNIIDIIFNKFNLFSPHLISMSLLRPISGNASLGIIQEIFKLYGPDSFNGFMASLLQGSTETTIYVVALYYGSVGVKKIRNTLKIGLIVDFFGILLTFLLCYFIYNYFMWYNFLGWSFYGTFTKSYC